MRIADRTKRRSDGLARTLLLWLLVFLVVELSLALLDADAAWLALFGAAVLALGSYDVLRRELAMTKAGLAAAASIATVGVFMALEEASIAPGIVDTLFLGLVLAAAGIAIVAVGGGGITAMRPRWETWLARWDAEAGALRTRRQQTVRRDLDLRERRERLVERGDDTTLIPDGVPAGDVGAARGDTTQERIRADIRSDRDTLP